MDIEIPLFVMKLSGLTKPKYLVIQTEVRGAANTTTVVYAEVFYTRKAAKKAEAEADSRLRIKIGNRTFGKRGWSTVLELPIDKR